MSLDVVSVAAGAAVVVAVAASLTEKRRTLDLNILSLHLQVRVFFLNHSAVCNGHLFLPLLQNAVKIGGGIFPPSGENPPLRARPYNVQQ